ncbi:MAG TPA: competence protein CoiA family protein [Ramlibacter sp.]
MPFSALAPEGPVTLLGADAITVENLRRRNRLEGCFTAKCCGAPLTVRTAPGKAPHFVHKVVPASCEGDRRETAEHERLKEFIAVAAAQAREWSVETEAVHRDPQSRRMLWRADVLARRRRAAVAFEVQLSNADFALMRSRQERYRAHGVRGLWFVRTNKAFPASRELPIFVVEPGPGGDRVRLVTLGDRPFICALTDDAAGMELGDFVRSVLAGELMWAPFEQAPGTRLQAWIDYARGDPCPGCGRLVAEVFCARARIAGVPTYPEFQFAPLPRMRRGSGWYQPLVDAVWEQVRGQLELTLRGPRDTCSRCGTPLGRGSGTYAGETVSLGATLQLKDLPAPRFGSVEQAWLRRWAVVAGGRATMSDDAATARDGATLETP